MKGSRGMNLLRSLAPLAGLVLAGAGLSACGDDDKALNPEAVGVEDLKYASGLNIVDLGNGSVRLYWNGSNNEEDFSGYNVYGKKGGTDGPPIKLLDDEGEEVEEGKKALEAMSYNGTDWETTATPAADKDSYSFTPYYKAKNAEGKPVLPTCQPTGAEAAPFGLGCATLAAETSTPSKLNGRTYIDLSGLKVGSTYCFTVLATLDEGTQGAQTTSEVKCVTPRAQVSASAVSVPACKGSGNYSARFNLKALRTACATGTCGNLTVDTADGDCGDGTTMSDGSTNATACLEVFPRKGNTAYSVAAFASTGISGVQDIGYYTGYLDLNLQPAPKLAAGVGKVQSKDGYNSIGQSLRVFPNHMYVFAEIDGANTYYHYAYVTAAPVIGGASTPLCDGNAQSVTVDWRISTLAGAR